MVCRGDKASSALRPPPSALRHPPSPLPETHTHTNTHAHTKLSSYKPLSPYTISTTPNPTPRTTEPQNKGRAGVPSLYYHCTNNNLVSCRNADQNHPFFMNMSKLTKISKHAKTC